MIAHQFGLIGYPLSHSFSKKYFNRKFSATGLTDHHYELFPLENINELPGLLKSQPNLRGLNVTIPYKESVLDFLDDISVEAQEIGAVNTIRIHRGKLTGENTDVYGFEVSLQKLIATRPTDGEPLRALVLGTGGAAKAVVYILNKNNISWQYVSRTAGDNRLTYDDLTNEIVANNRLIINTTPLGMSPNVATCPEVPMASVSKGHFFYDLVYNPEKTVLLSKAEQKGAAIKNGLEMLHLQAEKAWQIWNQVV